MRLRSLLITSAIAIGVVNPVMAQQSTNMHRYALFFQIHKSSRQSHDGKSPRSCIRSREAVRVIGWKDGSNLFFWYEW